MWTFNEKIERPMETKSKPPALRPDPLFSRSDAEGESSEELKRYKPHRNVRQKRVYSVSPSNWGYICFYKLHLCACACMCVCGDRCGFLYKLYVVRTFVCSQKKMTYLVLMIMIMIMLMITFANDKLWLRKPICCRLKHFLHHLVHKCVQGG